MLFALDKGGNRVYASENTERNKEYFCPVCQGAVRLRAGSVNVPHFAHVDLGVCVDDFSNDMSEWHREWQMLFPEKNREVVITHDGESHRADVLCYGTVIEFQHSPISEVEFWRRNEFYTSAGYKVVWIFDVVDLFCDWDFFVGGKTICCFDEHDYGSGGGKFRWKRAWRFLANFLPQEEKNITIFFNFIEMKEIQSPKSADADGYIERIAWVKPDNNPAWSYFHTSYDVTNYYGLLEWLRKRWETDKNVNMVLDVDCGRMIDKKDNTKNGDIHCSNWIGFAEKVDELFRIDYDYYSNGVLIKGELFEKYLTSEKPYRFLVSGVWRTRYISEEHICPKTECSVNIYDCVKCQHCIAVEEISSKKNSHYIYCKYPAVVNGNNFKGTSKLYCRTYKRR